jgi:predicted Rossmann fold flavoprotein
MYDVIVIGAGPAGMMASITSAANNNKVLLIEKNASVGKKLALTGGTRCNLTNLKSINDFIKEIPVNNKMLYSTLNKFGPQDIYDYFNKLGVSLKVEDNDRVFPVDNKATTVIEALYQELIKYKVDINFNETVKEINNNNDYKIVVTDKDSYKTNKIIITTGGCSYPQTGSTGDGYKLAKMLNQEVTKLYPAETFLITKESIPLAGLTLDDVLISLNKKQVNGSLLFTHIGLSGPAIFKISEEVYKQLQDNKYVSINIDLIPNYTLEELLIYLNEYDQKKEIISFVREYLPKRLADYITNDMGTNAKIGTISKIKKQLLIENIKNFKIDIKATGTIEQSFVTGGGIDIKNINPKTMESTINKGIYFAGEILDIHGHTGGYNITIALSTGYVAGMNKEDL